MAAPHPLGEEKRIREFYQSRGLDRVSQPSGEGMSSVVIGGEEDVKPSAHFFCLALHSGEKVWNLYQSPQYLLFLRACPEQPWPTLQQF